MASLSVTQVREDITDPDAVIVDRHLLSPYDIRLHGRLLGVLYVKASVPHPPPWLSYFRGLVDLTDTRVVTASSAAVLLLQRDGRLYAVTFGYGRSLLQDGVAEPRFGLKATLNAIEPTHIRSIDHVRMEAVSRLTREQVSRDSDLYQFGLDVERDLVRAVTGTPTDLSLGSRLTGADHLAVTGDIPITRLGAFIDRLAHLAREKTYQAHFPWIDNIAEVADTGTRRILDEKLADRIARNRLDKIWLAPPEVLQWEDIAGFRYRSAEDASVFDDLNLGDYFTDCRPRREVTIERLRGDRVRCVGAADGNERQKWSVYRCLIAEIGHARATFVLSDGKWYRVGRDFLEMVDGAVAQLRPSELRLPEYRDRSEEAYNRRAAAESHGSLVLMDKALVRPAGRDGVEVCDLYSVHRQLVHVKRYGGSSVLSHLFSQGTVSAQLLLSEQSFRQGFSDQLPASHRLADPAAPLVPGDYEVAYAIVASTPRPTVSLPFFSKVNLRNAARLLGQLGYHVTLTPILNGLAATV